MSVSVLRGLGKGRSVNGQDTPEWHMLVAHWNK